MRLKNQGLLKMAKNWSRQKNQMVHLCNFMSDETASFLNAIFRRPIHCGLETKYEPEMELH
jgi:hypothetical protein